MNFWDIIQTVVATLIGVFFGVSAEHKRHQSPYRYTCPVEGCGIKFGTDNQDVLDILIFRHKDVMHDSAK